MQRKLTLLMLLSTVVWVFAGCSGGGVDQVTDFLFGGDDDGDVLLDGQLIRTIDSNDDDLRLRGLPEGRHLLHVTTSQFRGLVRLIDVEPNTDFDLSRLQAEIGGHISGTVTLAAGDGSTRPAARTAVYAIPGGASLVAAGQSITTIPPSRTHYVTYTDGNGDYELNAVTPGDYLVTAPLAGYMADVQFVGGLSARARRNNVNLELPADGSEPAGTVQGIVSGRTTGGAASLTNASLRAHLGTAYRPDIPADTINRIANSYGGALRDAPWFGCEVLSTLTDAGGGYDLSLPPGTPRVDCFVYRYEPASEEPTITDGTVTPVDFTLNER